MGDTRYSSLDPLPPRLPLTKEEVTWFLQKATVSQGAQKSLHFSLDLSGRDVDIGSSQVLHNFVNGVFPCAVSRDFHCGLVQVKPPFGVEKQVATCLSIDTKAHLRMELLTCCFDVHEVTTTIHRQDRQQSDTA